MPLCVGLPHPNSSREATARCLRPLRRSSHSQATPLQCSGRARLAPNGTIFIIDLILLSLGSLFVICEICLRPCGLSLSSLETPGQLRTRFGLAQLAS